MTPSDFKILTDRSRSLEYQRCPRARFLGYHWGGRGVALAGLSVPLVTGSHVHIGVGALLRGEEVQKAVDAALAAYGAEVERRGFADPHPDMLQTVAEQRALVEALVRVFALRRLPALLAEYEVLGVEREDEFVLTEIGVFDGPARVPVVFMARADALLRQHETGDLYAYSLKTASEWSQTRDDEARHDMQGLSEVAAVEERLAREGRPEQVMGVQMDYLIKGRRNKSTGWRQDSHLVRPWRKVEQFGTEWAWRSERPCTDAQCKYHLAHPSPAPFHRLGKEWTQVNVWEHMPVCEWMEMLTSGAVQPECGDPFAEVLVTPVPYFRQRADMESWQRQMEGQEGRVARRLVEDAALVREPTAEWLDEFWPQHRRACDWYDPGDAYERHEVPRKAAARCPFARLCHEVEDGWHDPLSEGYVWREPHHASEQNA